MDSRGHQRPLKLKGIVLYTIFVSRRLTMYWKMWTENQMTVEFWNLSQCHSLHSPPRIGIFLWWLVSKKYPWSRKCVIFKLKSSQKCYIFGDFLNCTMFNSSILGSLKSLDVVINFFVNVCVPHFGHLKPAWSHQIRCTYFRRSQAVQSFKWRLKQSLQQ